MVQYARGFPLSHPRPFHVETSVGLLPTLHILGTSENFLKTEKPRPFTAAAVIGAGLSTSATSAANGCGVYAQPWRYGVEASGVLRRSGAGCYGPQTLRRSCHTREQKNVSNCDFYAIFL